MLPLSISRNRKADREKQVHNQAVQRAFERKAIREFVKANPDVLTDEEDIQDSEQEPKKDFPSLKKRISQGHQTEQKKADQFFDVCNEKINTLSINDVPKAKKPKKKKTLTSEEKSSKKAAGGSKKRPSKKSKKKQANIEVVTTKD